MPPLYVTQQNSKIRIRNHRLLVEVEQGEESHELISVPIGQVSQVVVFGNVGITTPAIQALMLQEVEVVFLTQEGIYLGRLESKLTPHVPLRRAQYERLKDTNFTLEMAKGFLHAKLAHQRALLQRHNRERQNEDIQAVIAMLNQALDQLPRKTQLSSILGLEGSTTAAYFRGFRKLFAIDWGFENRNRRPPLDPVNVLLSFGYTLLTNLARSAIEVTGLDPYAGFLHEIAYNRPALGLDLMEEFRPVVDGIVLWCLNGGIIKSADFRPGEAGERPIVLSNEAAREFVKSFETRMEQKFTHPLRGMQFPLRLCILEQAYQVSRRITNGPPGYDGMGFR